MADTTAQVRPARTPAISVMDMPIEILRQIFLSIDGEFSKTLWSLCLTCRHFRDIVEEYCEPDYNLRGMFIKDPYALMERIKVQPCLRNLIRVARMECDFAEHTTHTEEQVQTLIASLGLALIEEVMMDHWGLSIFSHDGGSALLVALLPQIEIIELSTPANIPISHWNPLITLLNDPQTENRLHTHGFDRLRELTLLYPPFYTQIAHHPKFYDNLYIGVLRLPSLRTVNLDNIMLNQEEWSDTFHRQSTVAELRIQTFQESLMYPEYDKEWRTFTCLRKLTLHVEMSFISYEEGYHEPPEYINCLASRAHSLKELYLYTNEIYCSADGEFQEMSTHCPGQPSLKHFSKLKALALTDLSLVGITRSGPAHWYQSSQETLDHLAGMFPSSLQSFTHVLWHGPTIFDKRLTTRQKALHSWENIWKASSRQDFPNLKQVMVQKYGVNGLSSGPEVIWESKYWEGPRAAL